MVLTPIVEFYHAPVKKIPDECLVLCPVMCRRQPYRKPNALRRLPIYPFCLKFLGNSEQGEDKETVILGLVPFIRDALV